MLINALRGHLAEFGIIAARGTSKVGGLAAIIDGDDGVIPDGGRRALRALAAQIEAIEGQIEALAVDLLAWHEAHETSRCLATIPGIGPLTASALSAAVPDARVFSSGRQFAAWLGLVPRQNSTGGKSRLGHISKQGDSNLRRLLIIGAQSVLRWSRPAKSSPWVLGMLGRRPRKVVAVALANKMARIAWALMVRGEIYQRPTIQTMPA
jgi:transposase